MSYLIPLTPDIDVLKRMGLHFSFASYGDKLPRNNKMLVKKSPFCSMREKKKNTFQGNIYGKRIFSSNRKMKVFGNYPCWTVMLVGLKNICDSSYTGSFFCDNRHYHDIFALGWKNANSLIEHLPFFIH